MGAAFGGIRGAGFPVRSGHATRPGKARKDPACAGKLRN
jgi:hypothetical protein